VRCPVVLALLALSSGCSPEPGSLVVQVRSDLTPTVEVGAFGVELRGEGVARSERLVVNGTQDLGAGVRVATLEGLTPASYDLEVSALAPDGATIVVRPVRVTVEPGAQRVVTVLLTRDCGGVSCPGGGAPTDVACLAGRCVPEGCTEEHPERCPAPECASDMDCGGRRSECAASACSASGACFLARDRPCPDGEVCAGVEGCVPTGSEATWHRTVGHAGADASAPSLAFAVDHLVVAWSSAADGVRAASVSLDAAPLGEVGVSSTGSGPRLASRGGGPAMVLATEPGGLAALSLDPDGVPDGSPVDLGATPADPLDGYAAAWSGRRLGILWGRGRDGSFRLTSTDLSEPGPVLGGSVTSGSPLTPDLAWDGTSFVAAWSEDWGGLADTHLAFAGEDTTSLALLSVGMTPAASSEPAVASDGTTTAVAQVERGSDGVTEVDVYPIDEMGRPAGAIATVSDPARSPSVSSPDLAVRAAQWAVVWRDGDNGLGFALVDPTDPSPRAIASRAYPVGLASAPSILWAAGAYYVVYLTDMSGACCDIGLTRVAAP